jgi:hypothetical protein
MDIHDLRFNIWYRTRRFARLVSSVLLLIGTFAAISPAVALTFAQTAHQGPSLAVFNNKIYIAVTGTNAQSTIYINSSSDGINWPGTFQSLAPLASIPNAGPALAAFNGSLYLAWTNGGGNQIEIAHSSDGVNFGGTIDLGTNSAYISTGSPALTATANDLVLSWLGTTSGQQAILTSYSTDGVNWSTPLAVVLGSESVAPYGPAVSAFNNTAGGTTACVGYIVPASNFSPTRRIVATSVPAVGGCSLPVQSEEPYTTGVGMGKNGSSYYLIWVGTHLSDQIRIWSYTISGATFTYTGETLIPQTTFTNPAIAGFNGHTFYAWSGTDNPSHVNVAQFN